MTNQYNLPPAMLRRIKKAAKTAGISWQSIAARPGTAVEFCERVEHHATAKKGAGQ